MRALIIGCGSIGALKPLSKDGPDTPYPLTHAHAARMAGIPGEGLYFYDSEISKMEMARLRWGGNVVVDSFNQHYDIAIIACPTEYHWEMLRALLEQAPQPPCVVVVEKPCGWDSEACAKIVRASLDYNFRLIVNYNRAFCDMPQLKTGEMVKSFRAIYARGLRRDGCHALERARYYCGDMGQIFGVGPVIDELPGDLTLGFTAEFARCPQVTFTPVRGADYDVFDLDILTSQRRILMPLHGRYIREWPVATEEIYGEYRSLGYDFSGIFEHTDLQNSLLRLWVAAIAVARGEYWGDRIPGGVEALSIHKMIERIHNKYRGSR